MIATDKELAVCQMNTLRAVLFGGGMDIQQALIALGLNERRYLKLAEKEGLMWIAEHIDKILAKGA